ncbi:hypothetical protein CU044_1426 [Streptomyces sp. L-9-10]|nr:hypothetical protein CU044_1426 [Streptomyces sp. L-9-10]
MSVACRRASGPAARSRRRVRAAGDSLRRRVSGPLSARGSRRAWRGPADGGCRGASHCARSTSGWPPHRGGPPAPYLLDSSHHLCRGESGRRAPGGRAVVRSMPHGRVTVVRAAECWR